jgi:hypothetical protein
MPRENISTNITLILSFTIFDPLQSTQLPLLFVTLQFRDAMKVLSLLCLIVSATESQAWFSFSNLLFATGICKVPGPRCRVHCGGPLHPKKFCGCASTRRQLTDDTSSTGTECYDSTVCDEFEGSTYQQCIAHATFDNVNEDSSAAVSSESSISEGRTSAPISSSKRINWLAIAIGAAVLTMLLLVAVKIRRKKASTQWHGHRFNSLL